MAHLLGHALPLMTHPPPTMWYLHPARLVPSHTHPPPVPRALSLHLPPIRKRSSAMKLALAPSCSSSSSCSSSCSRALRRKPPWLSIALHHLSPEQRALRPPNAPAVYHRVPPAAFEPPPPPPPRCGAPYGDAHVAAALSAVLQRTCDRNARCCAASPSPPSPSPPSPSSSLLARSSNMFYNARAAPFALSSYVLHVVSRLRVSRSAYVVALVYLDRVRLGDARLCVSHMNVHRVLGTALCLADKFVEDESHHNKTLSTIMGMQHVAELNAMEAAFLHRIGWHCWVSEHTFAHYQRALFPVAAAATTSSSSACSPDRPLAPPEHARAAVALHTAAVHAARTLSSLTTSSAGASLF